MRVKDFSKAIALLMIYLIISLTFFSAMVFGYIANPQAYGQDKVPGIIRQTDNVVFRAESTFPLSISSYFTNNNPVAMSCSGANGIYNCSYSTGVNSVTGPVWATLRENTPGTNSATVEAYPDFTPPSIQWMVPSSRGNRVSAQFSIYDESSPTSPTMCSGFKKVELYLNNQLINTTNYSMGICSVDGGIIEGSIPNYVGQVNVTLKIEDYVGGRANYTHTGDPILIATKKPVIRQTVKVYKAPGTAIEVRTVSNNTNFVRDVDVSIEIESAAMEQNRVFADFTQFDQTNSVDQSNVAAICQRNMSWTAPYICTFHNIKLATTALTMNFVVSATDDMDNFANATLRASFTRHAGANVIAAKVYKAGTTDQITKISTNATAIERTVDIAVEITDSAEVTSAVGDFEEIHRNLGIGQDNIQTQNCYLNDSTSGGTTNHYTCLFQNLYFNPSVTNPKIIIRVIDELGAQTEKSISLPFGSVPNGGTVTRLGPEPSRCVSGMCYVRETDNNITAEISMISTYFDSNVDLQGVPAACTQENSRWVCQQYISFNLNDKKLYLTGTDDYGNQIAAVTNITVDNDAPVKLTNFTMSPICPTSSETLKISMNVSEQKSPGVIISADTSAISSKEITTASCTKIGTTKNYQCTLSVNNLKEEEINTELQIIVEDLAGNQVANIDPLSVSICIAIDEIPDMIEQVQTTGALPKVDKKTADKITVKTAVGLEIVLNNDEAEVVDRAKPQCAGPGLTGSAYTISDIGLNPIIVLPLKYNEAWDEDDKVIINCSQQFKIRIGNRIYTEKEPENYTITLTAFNQPLGSLDKSYEKKVTKIKKQIRVLDNQIVKYTKTFDKIGKYCALAEGLGKVNTLLQAVRGTVLAFCLIPGIGQTIGQALWKIVDKVVGKYQAFVDYNIWPQGWVPTHPPDKSNAIGLVIKGTCAIYTCKFYDFNTWVEIGMSYATYYQQKADAKKEAAKQAEANRQNQIYVDAMEIYGNQAYQMDADGNLFYDSKGVRYYIEGPKRGMIENLGGSGTENPGGSGVNFNLGQQGGGQFNLAPKYKDSKGNIFQLKDSNNPLSRTYVTGPNAGQTISNRYDTYTTVQPEVQTGGGTGGGSQKGQTGNLQSNAQASSGFVGPPAPTQPTVNLNLFIPANTILNPNPLFPTLFLLTGKVVADSSQNQITGNLLGGLINTKGLTPGWGTGGYAWFDLNARLGIAVDAFMGDSGSWVFNPYKSKHYDALCIAATGFNKRKERQLLCKRLVCIDQMQEKGGPLEACEFDYSLGMCMYVDSARYKLEGSAGLGTIFGSIVKTFFSNVLGNGAFYTYWALCGLTLKKADTLFDASSQICTSPGSFKRVACGITGSLLSLGEIAAFAEGDFNPMSSTTPLDPVKQNGGNDFCQGIDLT